MKTKLTKMIMGSLSFVCALVCLLAAMTLSTQSTAQAAPDGRCHSGQLQGLYIWTFDGYQNFGGNRLPKALLQGIQFNGNGSVTTVFGTANIAGTVVFDTSGAQGVYTVNSDCTGTMLFGGPGGPAFNMYIGPGAQQIWTTQTGGGPGDGTGLGQGTATRVP